MRDYAKIKESCQRLAECRRKIIELFPKNGIGAEIGVLYGQFSKLILEIAKPRILYLVDPWSHDDKFGDRTPEQMNDIYNEVETEIGWRENVHLMRMESAEFFQLYPTLFYEKLDYIYIDGDHSREKVLADLRGAMKLVKPGGLIVGDDMSYIKGWGYSVFDAVDAFSRIHSVPFESIPVEGHTSQFVIRRP